AAPAPGSSAGLAAVDPLDGHDAAVVPVPVDRWDAVAFEAFHRLGQLGGRGRLAAEVELAVGPALEVGDRRPRAQPAGLAAERLEMRRGPFVSVDVAREALADARAQDLDRHRAAVAAHPLVDLRDRGRTDRVGLDFGEQLLDRALEAALHLEPDRLERHR